jgi:peroxiredoxin
VAGWLSGQRVEAQGCSPDAPAANLDFTLKDMNGAEIKLADLKGKVVLLNFWATWCGPCRLEIPSFVELQEKYAAQGFRIIGISVDDPPEALPPFAKRFKINYPLIVGADREDVQKAYGPIFGVPMTFIIGRNGRICMKHVGPASKEQFESEIKSLL